MNSSTRPLSKRELREITNCRRLLRMASELHIRGYQKLRVVPHLYSIGTWRCGITSSDNICRDHGAMACRWDWEYTPQYTSASGRKCFDWQDAERATPSRLADMFLEQFPEVCRRGYGSDWEYAGWLSWMLHETYPDCLPVSQGDFLEIPAGDLLTIRAREIVLASPPPGTGNLSA